MQSAFYPTHTELVLVGGGHAHVFVLKAFAMKPVPGVRLTLITPTLDTPYSGMLPGYVAGHYGLGECHINLLDLARFAGARVIQAEAVGIDRDARRVLLAGRPPIAFDVLSLNTGITPALSGIQGAAEHAIAVKPIATFAERWEALAARVSEADGPRHFGVIGGGAAGFELVLAMAHRVRQLLPAADQSHCRFSLITSAELLPSHPPRARLLAEQALQHAGVALYTHQSVRQIDAEAVHLASGQSIPMQACLVATRAKPAEWLADTGLTLDKQGFIVTRDTLQSESDEAIFAVGDCAVQRQHPRARAGVFAVRQGPVLAHNLRAKVLNQPLRAHRPQTHFLTLLALGDQSAIASRGRWALSGRWAWRWKDRIDRQFMAKFSGLTAAMQAKDPEQQALMARIGCNGCAAKVGPQALSQALARLQQQNDATVARQQDDAVCLRDAASGHWRVESVDFLRAFCTDPYLLGRVAANHALSDVYAMGARATHAQALAVVPYAEPHIVEEDLFQLLAGAESVFQAAGVQLLGGHSSKDTQMALGFHVSGTLPDEGAALKKTGLAEGDQLILTQALGSGVLLAAEMRGCADARAVSDLFAQMGQSNQRAAELMRAHGARALTDVTGFGLLGHLLEMLRASNKDAELHWRALPLLPSVLELAEQGVRSSLLAENLAAERCLAEGHKASEAQLALLCDPQTAGGLLAGVPAAQSEALVDALQRAGFAHACVIGQVMASARGPRVQLH